MAGAVAELEALLADLVRVLGADHPGTLAARGNLAGWRGEAGDVAGAVTGYEGRARKGPRCWVRWRRH